MKNTFDIKADEMMKKARFIQAIGGIYESLVDRCNWDCRRYNQPDETHPEPYFTEYEDGELTDYQIAQYEAYKAIFAAIEKMAK